MNCSSLTKLFWITATVLATALPALADDLLAPADLEAYYHTTFSVTKQADAKDPALKDAAPVTQLTFTSTGTEARKHLVMLVVRTSDGPAAAQKACDAVRDQYGKSGIKIEDAPGIGDHAFWFGRQLNFSKGNLSFILSATGLTEHRDQTQARAAASELAKQLLAHLP